MKNEIKNEVKQLQKASKKAKDKTFNYLNITDPEPRYMNHPYNEEGNFNYSPSPRSNRNPSTLD